MDNTREKLIEILRNPIFPHELADPTEAVADYLLDNGVTVQKWIPVTERLPEFQKGNVQKYLTIQEGFISNKPIYNVLWFGKKGWYRYDSEYGDVWVKDVTHWMPLPQAPKEEPTQNADRCVCCGAIIPEGRMVCPNCETSTKNK